MEKREWMRACNKIYYPKNYHMYCSFGYLFKFSNNMGKPIIFKVIMSNFTKKHILVLCVVNLFQSHFKLKQFSPNVSKILIESDATEINWCIKCKWHIVTIHSNQSNPWEYEKASGYFEKSRSVIILSKLFDLQPVSMVLLIQ